MEKLIYEGSGQRIDIFLAQSMDYSRSFFHHLIERDVILVNSKPVKKSYLLKNGDIIEIESFDRFFNSGIFEEVPRVDLPIRLEKDDYMVIYKPKGVISHPCSVWDVSRPSVVSFLYHHYKNLPSIGNFIRAGLVHRLDKDTDGLMIIAKSEKGLKYFKDLFNKKSKSETIQQKEDIPIKKFYRAKVIITQSGKDFLEQIKDKLPYYIEELVKPKLPHVVQYKNGITKIWDIEYLENNQALLNIEILTGRTHQIRYHLSINGLPIFGDDLYGKKENTLMELTAYRLEFTDVQGEKIVITV